MIFNPAVARTSGGGNKPAKACTIEFDFTGTEDQEYQYGAAAAYVDPDGNFQLFYFPGEYGEQELLGTVQAKTGTYICLFGASADVMFNYPGVADGAEKVFEVQEFHGYAYNSLIIYRIPDDAEYCYIHLP